MSPGGEYGDSIFGGPVGALMLGVLLPVLLLDEIKDKLTAAGHHDLVTKINEQAKPVEPVASEHGGS